MEHDSYVKLVIPNLQREGANRICADLEGFDKPFAIKGFIPDVTAYFVYKTIICEIETPEEISTDHTKQQCQAFASSGYEFRLYVPQDIVSTAKINLLDWGISSKTKIYYF